MLPLDRFISRNECRSYLRQSYWKVGINTSDEVAKRYVPLFDFQLGNFLLDRLWQEYICRMLVPCTELRNSGAEFGRPKIIWALVMVITLWTKLAATPQSVGMFTYDSPQKRLLVIECKAVKQISRGQHDICTPHHPQILWRIHTKTLQDVCLQDSNQSFVDRQSRRPTLQWKVVWHWRINVLRHWTGCAIQWRAVVMKRNNCSRNVSNCSTSFRRSLPQSSSWKENVKLLKLVQVWQRHAQVSMVE